MRRCLALIAWLAVAACSSSTTAAHPSPSPSPFVNRMPTSAAESVPGGCGNTQVYKGGEPDWLRTAGANNNPSDLPYFIPEPPTATGFLFGYPLQAGTRTRGSNKIQWVVRIPRKGNGL